MAVSARAVWVGPQAPRALEVHGDLSLPLLQGA